MLETHLVERGVLPAEANLTPSVGDGGLIGLIRKHRLTCQIVSLASHGKL